MYRVPSPGQLSFENFYLPFGGKLRSDNRWVLLASMIPWEEFEAAYAEQFSQRMGAPAKPFRMALGSLIIKEFLGISDEETIEQLSENPYLQYFVGMSGYCEQAPFDASMMVHFRKRIDMSLVVDINESLVNARREAAETEPTEANPNALSVEGESDESDDRDDEPPGNSGQLLLDATCAPADIRYPTDLSLLNDARAWSERLIDELYDTLKSKLLSKPRTYRQVARRRYVAIVRKKRPSRRLIRKGIGQQLRYLGRNLRHLQRLMDEGAALSQLSAAHYRMMLVIHEVYRQQQQMYCNKQRQIEHRIVSLHQPHVRPIVRGKARTPVEFGAKLSVSCADGWTFLDKLSWEAFNESTHLQQQAESYRRRFGQYPASIHADQIYRTRDNLRWCKERGIRLSGPPLGKPAQDPEVQAQLKRQARDDEAIRVAIEGKFAQAKRRFGLARVTAKLSETAQTSIAITVLVLNLVRALRLLKRFFCVFLSRLNPILIALALLIASIWGSVFRLKPDALLYRSVSFSPRRLYRVA